MSDLTITILIGNSDNKLTQSEWAEFYAHVDDAVNNHAKSVQFSGPSNGAAPWQNACWVAVVAGGDNSINQRLAVLAGNYKQDSIAVVPGNTYFVKPPSMHPQAQEE
jgi:hypothetical protein